ncbi:MAG: galactose mutarotase [Saprospiraceae bacterium]|nr:galactose mutarotase [Saprospiraceae bacterium]
MSKPQSKTSVLSISKKLFGTAPEGAVDLYTLSNANQMSVEILTFGGIIKAIYCPDKNGKIENVILGFNTLKPYLETHPYFGAIVGRYGNRIANGKFNIDGTEYNLATNNSPNHLHGGLKGFDKVIWQAREFKDNEKIGLELSYLSKDMEEGYPGNLNVKVTYSLNNQNELSIDYEAVTDKKTICNLTNHSYFNLAGEGKGNILNHQLVIHADSITPVNEHLIPTGEPMAVQGTPFDFRSGKKMGEEIDSNNEQIKYGGGFDHNFILKGNSESLPIIAKISEPESGREMEILTTEPGVQFYTGNFLDGTLIGSGNQPYQKRAGFCLETQHYPDSPNQPNFPSTILEVGETYKTTTVYRFKVK